MATSSNARARSGAAGGAWIAAPVAVLGLVALLLFAASNWLRDRLVAADLARLEALVQLQLSVTTVHLWLEEYVTGDRVDLSAISDNLTHADTLYRAMIDGGAVATLGVTVPALPEGAARDTALAAGEDLAAFAMLSQTRRQGFSEGADVGIGSPLDARYDGHYHDLMQRIRALEAATRTQLGERATLARRLGQAILITWLGIIVFAVTGLWTREVRRRRAEDALRAKELQLLHSQKMDAVGRLAGGITHDINTYLAAINTNCELVQMRSEPHGPIAEKMDAVLRICAKITSLIDRLLAFSKQLPGRRETVDLNAHIRDLQAMLVRVIGEDVEMTTHLRPGLWATRVDPSQVEQILVNLVVNARQAMPAGGKIEIRTDHFSIDAPASSAHGALPAGDYVMLQVADDGPGIDKAIRDRLFEPFFTTKDPATNSGLGLSTVYGNVVQSGGHIVVDNAAEGGAVFSVYFPRADALPEDTIEARDAAAVRSGEGCVLLVEDNRDFRTSARTLLEALGYGVVDAPDGSSALKTYAEHGAQIDLVLTDMVMPGMNGSELLAALRALPIRVPVVFMSGYTADAMLDRGLIDGPVPILRKPFSAADLSSRLREELAAQRS